MCLHIYASAISRFRDEPRSDNPWHASHAHPSDVEARRGSSRPRIHAPVAGFEGSFDILVFSKRKKKKLFNSILFNFFYYSRAELMSTSRRRCVARIVVTEARRGSTRSPGNQRPDERCGLNFFATVVRVGG